MVRGAIVSNSDVIFFATLAVASSKINGEFMSVGLIVRFSAK